MADDYGVTLDSAVEEQLLDRATPTASTPVYLDAVLSTVEQGGELTQDRVEGLPATVAGIWEQQYDRLAKTDEDALVVLEALKLLYDVGIPYFPPLVRGIYSEVLDQDPFTTVAQVPS